MEVIVANVDHLPYGLRFLVRVKRNALKEKFPKVPDREIFKVETSIIIIYRYL